MDNYIFCDESCHLPLDHKKAMVLGAVLVSREKRFEVYKNLRALKVKHGLNPLSELKWMKVSSSKIEYYEDVINYFFSEPSLKLRILVATGKDKLSHSSFDQSHDDWYFKMYYLLLKPFLSLHKSSGVFLDIKDTRSTARINKLHLILKDKLNDGDNKIIERIQVIHSHESELVQLADLFIGAISYLYNTDEATRVSSKLSLIEQIKKKSGIDLLESTSPGRDKLDLFIWKPKIIEAAK